MEKLKHECGIALIRLRKPLEYYEQKYGTWMYGLQKLYLLMEKQHNRGQEGAGLASVKLDVPAGHEYVFRERALGSDAISCLFETVNSQFRGHPGTAAYAKDNLPFAGELYMGHLRYSTTGKSGISYVHPFLRRNNWCAKTLLLCGNFNLTNVDQVFESLTAIGQHPRGTADTHILVEQMGHRLDMEIEYLYDICHAEGLRGPELTREIDKRLDCTNLLKKCAPLWDGGYTIAGMTGSGEMFCMRDPWGIRPAFYYYDDEMVVVASERPVIQTVLNVQARDVCELSAGSAILVGRTGNVRINNIISPDVVKPCSFERIYFSRGSDVDIYNERKKLGRNLVQPILKAVEYDFQHTVFSFIPNTAEVAYYGMLQGLEDFLNDRKRDEILEAGEKITNQQLTEILSRRVRNEKVAIKDIKLRTFIAEGKTRDDLAAHVYDITYGTINPGVDNLVVIDDSIVRGTTLKQSIIKILDRLHPRKIVIVSSSPQVRYPDCYGIDMSSMGQFIAFRAAIALLEERGMQHVIDSAYKNALGFLNNPEPKMINHVKAVYAPFSADEISKKIADLLTPEDTTAQVEIVYQSLEGLHDACPGHSGDWYFSGDYPTPGGIRWVNRAFVDYIEGGRS